MGWNETPKDTIDALDDIDRAEAELVGLHTFLAEKQRRKEAPVNHNEVPF